MLRHLSLRDMVRTVADIGYGYIELSPREDFIPFFVHPRADRDRVAELRAALRETGVQLVSLLPLYRWSGPDEDARQAAVRYWKRAIEIAVELECPVMNSEFNGRPERAAESEAQFWRSMETLLPIFERENMMLHLEAHPDDFIEQNTPALDLVRAINSSRVRYLYCAPHTFHLGDDVAAMLREAAPLLAQVHIADSFNHRRPPGCDTSSTRPGRQRASTSTWTSVKETSLGTPSSTRSRTSASTVSPRLACLPGRSAPGNRPVLCCRKSRDALRPELP
jgi:myo-inositol catabolism protein IolH